MPPPHRQSAVFAGRGVGATVIRRRRLARADSVDGAAGAAAAAAAHAEIVAGVRAVHAVAVVAGGVAAADPRVLVQAGVAAEDAVGLGGVDDARRGGGLASVRVEEGVPRGSFLGG